MIMSQSKKSKRSPNFSLAEVEVLVGEIDMHKHIIFAKQNNIITNSKKKIVWESIKENVNSVDNNTRTAEDIKKKWQMLASSVKAKWNLIRLESNKTGEYNILFIYLFIYFYSLKLSKHRLLRLGSPCFHRILKNAYWR